MKMLTGLLPATAGEAAPVRPPPSTPRDTETRRRVGYMSQSFSLYGELTVRQNLVLHARLFHLPRRPHRAARARDDASISTSSAVADSRPESLPLGMRQRLSAGRRGHSRPGDADPRRADLGRRSDRPRPVLALSHRSRAQRGRHDLHLHPLHERGRALRPHLAHACRQGAGGGSAAASSCAAAARRRSRRPSSPISRTAAPAAARRGAGAAVPTPRAAPRRRPPLRSAPPAGPMRAARPWRSCAIRSGSPSPSSAR